MKPGAGFRSLEVWLLGGLLILLATLSFVLGSGNASQPTGGGPIRRTVSSTKPDGWKAFRLLLDESGLKTRVVQRPPQDWPSDVDVMITGSPFRTSDWDEGEAKAALNWVKQGRSLILLVDENSDLTGALDLSVQTIRRQPLGRIIPVAARQPVGFLNGIGSLRLPQNKRFASVPKSGVALMADGEVTVIQMRREKGTVLAVSDVAFASNQHLTEDDNARFLVQVAQTFGGGSGGATGTIGFDEYHQGYRDDDTFLDAIGRPGRLMLAQILGLMLLVAYSASRRFGLPRPIPTAPRVSSEYVASLADLYRRARAADVALEGVYLAFWRDLCRALSVPFDADTPEVVARAARTLGAQAGPDLEARLSRLVGACESLAEEGSKISEQDLLTLSRDLEAMRKELGLGANHDNAV